jgi:hypothetical protein
LEVVGNLALVATELAVVGVIVTAFASLVSLLLPLEEDRVLAIGGSAETGDGLRDFRFELVVRLERKAFVLSSVHWK